MNRSLPRLEFEKERQTKGLCVICETKLTGRRTAFCSDECSNEYWRRHDWPTFRSRILRERNYTCEKCGFHQTEFPSYARLVLDHIIPLALGGRLFDESNVQVLCKECNKKKTANDLRAIAERKKTVRVSVIDFWNWVHTTILDNYITIVKETVNADCPGEIEGRKQKK